MIIFKFVVSVNVLALYIQWTYFCFVYKNVFVQLNETVVFWELQFVQSVRI